MQQAMAQYDTANKALTPSLDIRVIRSAADRNRFWWLVREVDRQIIESSPRTYASETEARSAAESAARTLRRREGW
jgi:hypothetical protein